MRFKRSDYQRWLGLLEQLLWLNERYWLHGVQEVLCVWCTVQSIHTTLAGYHVQLSFRKHCLIPHEIDILISYTVAMKSNDIWLPNTSSFIPHSGSVSSWMFFLCILLSSRNWHIAKQTSLAFPHASLPVLVSKSAAGCPVLSSDLSWQGSCHNVYFPPPHYWNFFSYCSHLRPVWLLEDQALF